MSDNIKEKQTVLLQGCLEDNTFNQLTQSKVKHAFVCEGRPNLDSAKRITKQLLSRKIKPTLIADNMAGFLCARKMIKEINIAYHSVNEDGALCDIGGLVLAILGKKHNLKVNLCKSEKEEIDLELIAKQKAVLEFNGQRVAPRGVQGYAPLVEWVPAKYVSNFKQIMRDEKK